jgi:hypothetical protein
VASPFASHRPMTFSPFVQLHYLGSERFRVLARGPLAHTYANMARSHVRVIRVDAVRHHALRQLTEEVRARSTVVGRVLRR